MRDGPANAEGNLTHRTLAINSIPFDVFDTQLAADKYRDKAEASVNIVVRNKSVFMRRDGVELTIRPDAGTGNDPRQAAARSILVEIEKMIADEKTKAA
jgi:hypothetical protein